MTMSQVDVEKAIALNPIESLPSPSSPRSDHTGWTFGSVASLVREKSQSFNSQKPIRFSLFKRPELSAEDQAANDEKTEWFRPDVQKIDDAPLGWPKLACFLDSDEDFMIYRRFGRVQSRLLLVRQEELRCLERQLDDFDKQMNREGDELILRCGNEAEDEGNLETRQRLYKDLQDKFCEYSQMLQAAQQMVALTKPATKDYKSVQNWLWINNPLDEECQSWIKLKEDLITLRPGREHAWLDAGLEYMLRHVKSKTIRNWFCSPETRVKAGQDEVYFTRSRINNCASFIITLMMLVLLVVPIFVLYHLVDSMGTQRTDAICIGVLLVFTLAFSAVLSLFTRAKRHEILAAAAGYCAVLVVFLGNVPDHKG